MGRKQTFLISDKFFNSKDEIVKYIQTILNGAILGESLKPNDTIFLCELLKRHPDFEKKVGNGIDCIEVRTDTEWGTTRQFWLIRKDGSSTDFSYLKCLKGEPTSKIALFRSASRSAIIDQISDFKKKYFEMNQDSEGKIPCEETGVPIGWHQCHVDHHPKSFFDLVNKFITKENIDIENVEYGGINDGEQRRVFINSGLAERFSTFHRNNAQLRIITPTANLTKKKQSVT